MSRHAKTYQSNQNLEDMHILFVYTHTNCTGVYLLYYCLSEQVTTFACSTLGMMWEVLASIVSLARCNDAGRMVTVLIFYQIGPLNFSTSNQSLKRCFPPLPPQKKQRIVSVLMTFGCYRSYNNPILWVPCIMFGFFKRYFQNNPGWSTRAMKKTLVV